MGVQPRIVSLWRHRYADHGLEGLQDKPRPGKQPIYTKTTDKRILKLLDKPPPQGFARWTGPLLAEALGDVDVQYVWRFLRSHKIDLVARKSWCESNDPNFTAKAADVVGLYVAPPAKAIVLCVDEKPSIQALERAQGYLKLPNGRALTGQSHDYKRHGTTTLFAALEVATGKIIATHSKRRRRVEFLDFMNSVSSLYIAQGCARSVARRILGRIGTSLDEALNARVFDTVVRLPLLVGNRNEGLQPLRDLDTVRSFLGSMGPGAFLDLPWLPFYLAICFAFHWLLGVTALAGAIVLVTLTLITEYMSRAPAKEAMTLAPGATILQPRAGATPRCWSRWAWPSG
ncbi:IS630 family transposase [Bradyrhizobium japonicum]|uniref:IS630 family transposase n=1 Tax=Bradyrhizobium japonicum TaxID=375 RepID=UPI003D2144D1